MNVIREHMENLSMRILDLENTVGKASQQSSVTNNQSVKKDEDDDVDLFGSDSEEESDAAAKIKEERLAAYNAKKSKSNI